MQSRNGGERQLDIVAIRSQNRLCIPIFTFPRRLRDVVIPPLASSVTMITSPTLRSLSTSSMNDKILEEPTSDFDPITVDEVVAATRALKTNKAAGPDGVDTEHLIYGKVSYSSIQPHTIWHHPGHFSGRNSHPQPQRLGQGSI